MSGARDAYQYINNTGQVSATGTAALLIAANTQRGGLTIVNTAASGSIYVGNAGVTATTGFVIPAGGSFTLPVQAAVYVITGGGTITVSFIEVQ